MFEVRLLSLEFCCDECVCGARKMQKYIHFVFGVCVCVRAVVVFHVCVVGFSLVLRVCFDDIVSCSSQETARKALDVLWEKRQRGSDLVGTVINIHNGDWVRRGESVQHAYCCPVWILVLSSHMPIVCKKCLWPLSLSLSISRYLDISALR